MTIRSKLLAAFSVIVLLAVTVAVCGIKVVSDASALVVRLYDGPLMSVSYARAAQLDLANVRRALAEGILMRDAAPPGSVARIRDGMKQFDADLKIVRERMAGAGADGAIDKAQAAAEACVKLGMTYLEPPAAGVTELPVPSVVMAKAEEAANAIDLVVEAASAYGFNFRASAEASAVQTRDNLILLAGVVVAIGLALGIGMAISFTRPVRRAMEISERIASGDFDSEIVTKRRDEFGRLITSLGKTQSSLREMHAEIRQMHESKERDWSEQLAAVRAQAEEERRRAAEVQAKATEEQSIVMRSLAEGLATVSGGDLTFRLDDRFSEAYQRVRDDFNATVDRLHDTIVAIARSTRDVAHTAGDIAGSTADLSQRTEGQAASLEKISSSMDSIAATVKKNAENALEANRVTAGTREVADRGGAVVSQAVGAMSRIEESSRKISDIITVIDEIARQTNLLALNAAVEAARAGEAGRGFAVVASEVRSLAQRSAQAAKDIKDLITNSSLQVQEGVELVNRAGSSLTEIVTSIKQVAEIVSGITSASAEQSTGLDRVNTALSEMDQATQQNSSLVEHNASAANALEAQSQDMQERVRFFRLGEGEGHAEQPAAKQAAPAAAEARPKSRAPATPKPAMRGGPVGRMQGALAVAIAADDWKEF
jgi:methyl-accepting chemotaxis protein